MCWYPTVSGLVVEEVMFWNVAQVVPCIDILGEYMSPRVILDVRCQRLEYWSPRVMSKSRICITCSNRELVSPWGMA